MSYTLDSRRLIAIHNLSAETIKVEVDTYAETNALIALLDEHWSASMDDDACTLELKPYDSRWLRVLEQCYMSANKASGKL